MSHFVQLKRSGSEWHRKPDTYTLQMAPPSLTLKIRWIKHEKTESVSFSIRITSISTKKACVYVFTWAWPQRTRWFEGVFLESLLWKSCFELPKQTPNKQQRLGLKKKKLWSKRKTQIGYFFLKIELKIDHFLSVFSIKWISSIHFCNFVHRLGSLQCILGLSW